jgi:hypothetical protein
VSPLLHTALPALVYSWASAFTLASLRCTAVATSVLAACAARVLQHPPLHLTLLLALPAQRQAEAGPAAAARQGTTQEGSRQALGKEEAMTGWHCATQHWLVLTLHASGVDLLARCRGVSCCYMLPPEWQSGKQLRHFRCA